jgi:DNA-directed RNA polymerase beta subunit
MFQHMDIESVGQWLEDMGLHRYGYKKLYDGKHGEFIDAEIFMGTVFYQRIIKFCVDAQYTVAKGPSSSKTYQPLDGKSSGGGLRIGEMERDVLIAHGAARFMAEKFFAHSDKYTEYVCGTCGKTATVNVGKTMYECAYCQDNATITSYANSWSSKLFFQEMEAMGVGVRRRPDPLVFTREDEEMFREIEKITSA